ncbi:hypothetical protein JCM14076_05600 [Methylosoma difficile]
MKQANTIKNLVLLSTLLSSGMALASDQWPMYQANPSHTGYSPVSLNASDIAFKWKKTLGTLPLNPVTAAEGRIFVSEKGYFGDQNLYVLSKDSSVLWSKLFSDINSVNPPSFADGKVYLQTGNHTLGTFLSAYDARNGNLIFQTPHEAQWERYYAPTIYKGTVYANGGYYGGMYAFNGKGGKKTWFAALNQYDQWTPAVDGQWVYAYVGSYSPGLYVVDRTTGAAVFNIADPDFVWDGWSMNLAPVLGGANDVYAIHDGRLIKFNTSTKAIQWQNDANYFGQPTFANNRLYAIASSTVVAVNKNTGAPIWTWQAPASDPLTSNIIATKTHLFVSSDSHTYCIDLSTHQSVWSYAVGGNLTLAESTLYVADKTGALSAFKLGLSDVYAPTTYFFTGGTPVNTTVSKNITLKNLGDKTLNISSVSSDSAVFKVETSPVAFAIPANQSKLIKVSFTPTSAATFTGKLIVKSDDANEPEVRTAMEGKGL